MGGPSLVQFACIQSRSDPLLTLQFKGATVLISVPAYYIVIYCQAYRISSIRVIYPQLSLSLSTALLNLAWMHICQPFYGAKIESNITHNQFKPCSHYFRWWHPYHTIRHWQCLFQTLAPWRPWLGKTVQSGESIPWDSSEISWVQ